MENRRQIINGLVTFLVLTFILTIIAVFIILNTRQANFIALVMWCPAISAVIAMLIFHKTLKGMGWKFGGVRYGVISYLTPILYAGIAYGLVWLTGLGGINSEYSFKVFAGTVVIPVNLLGFILLGTLVHAAFAAGEEIGWRGYLIPQLHKLTRNFTVTAFISGIIWAIWHYPLVLLVGYHQSAGMAYSLLMLTLQVMSAGFVAAWLRLISGSLWTGVLFHTAQNLWIQQFYNPLTTDTGVTKLLIGEFGVVTTVVLMIVAVVFWVLRRRLPS